MNFVFMGVPEEILEGRAIIKYTQHLSKIVYFFVQLIRCITVRFFCVVLHPFTFL